VRYTRPSSDPRRLRPVDLIGCNEAPASIFPDFFQSLWVGYYSGMDLYNREYSPLTSHPLKTP